MFLWLKKAQLSHEILGWGLGEMGSSEISLALWRLWRVELEEGSEYPSPDMALLLGLFDGKGGFRDVGGHEELHPYCRINVGVLG